MIKKIRIYDLDGTLCDSSHRYRTINGKIDLDYWRANEHRCYDDLPLPLAMQYKQELLDTSCLVIIATARVIHRSDFEYIRHILGMPDYLISRPYGSDISGGILKIEGLDPILREYNHVTDIVFYEDNTSYLKAVCDYFKIRGVYVPSNQGH
jgi:hypothetical protein